MVVVGFLGVLVLVSLAFALAEHVIPARRQPALRAGLTRDLAYLVINGHVVGVLLALAAARAARLGLGTSVMIPHFGGAWHPALQLATQLVLFDLLQWCVHNLLHHVEFLWRFHRVHHQIQVLDWIGNFHFHPLEILVYRTLLWLPSALFFFDPAVLLASAAIGTAWGYFNHANLRAPLGHLAYVINGPEMHLWHHAHLDETGGRPINLAIIFSMWDWLFGTAVLPPHPPRRLGFPGVEEFPENLSGQLVEPFGVRASEHRDAGPVHPPVAMSR